MHIDPATDSLSYWHATEQTIVPSADLPATAEVVVIGAGMLGVWTAYWLARAGADVVVLEKSAIGWGATGRNGGFLIEGAAVGYERLVEMLGPEQAKALYTLTLQGQKLAHEAIAEEEIACNLRVTGTLHLSLSDAEAQSAATHVGLLAEQGFPTDLLDRAQVQALIDTPLADEIVGGTLARSGGMLHSTRYLGGLARGTERYGARYVLAQAHSIDAHEEGATVRTSAGTIHAGQVVVALNAWTETLIPETHGVIVPTRGQILAYKPITPVFHTAIGAEVTPTGEYWQQTMDGSIVIGGCRADAPGMDSDVRQMVPTADVTAKIEHVLPRLFPALTDLEVDRRWAGLMAFTADGLPVVDQSEQSGAVWYGGGFCGHGMPYGPILGKLLAQSVTNGESAPELAVFSHERATLR